MERDRLVFTTALGEPCDPRNALRALKAAANQAGLPNIGLHTLRHSAASTMLANGVPLKVVSDILGHSSISITGDIYGHVSPDISVSAMRVLSDALR
jgi:integrase